jgi:hypothetical protein
LRQQQQSSPQPSSLQLLSSVPKQLSLWSPIHLLMRLPAAKRARLQNTTKKVGASIANGHEQQAKYGPHCPANKRRDKTHNALVAYIVYFSQCFIICLRVHCLDRRVRSDKSGKPASVSIETHPQLDVRSNLLLVWQQL